MLELLSRRPGGAMAAARSKSNDWRQKQRGTPRGSRDGRGRRRSPPVKSGSRGSSAGKDGPSKRRGRSASSAGSLRGALASLSRARSAGRSKDESKTSALHHEPPEQGGHHSHDRHRERPAADTTCVAEAERTRRRPRSADARPRPGSALHSELHALRTHRAQEGKSSHLEVDALLGQLGVPPAGGRRRARSACPKRNAADFHSGVAEGRGPRSRSGCPEERTTRSFGDLSGAYRPRRSRSRRKEAENESVMARSHDYILHSSRTRPSAGRPSHLHSGNDDVSPQAEDDATAPVSNASRYCHTAQFRLSSSLDNFADNKDFAARSSSIAGARPMAQSCNDALPQTQPLSPRPKHLARSCDDIYSRETRDGINSHMVRSLSGEYHADGSRVELTRPSSAAATGQTDLDGNANDSSVPSPPHTACENDIGQRKDEQASTPEEGRVENIVHMIQKRRQRRRSRSGGGREEGGTLRGSVTTAPAALGGFPSEDTPSEVIEREVNRRVAAALRAAGVDPTDPDVACRLSQSGVPCGGGDDGEGSEGERGIPTTASGTAKERGEDSYLSETERTDPTAATTVTASTTDDAPREHQSLPSFSNGAKKKKKGRGRHKKKGGAMPSTKKEGSGSSTSRLRRKCSTSSKSLKSVPERHSLKSKDGTAMSQEENDDLDATDAALRGSVPGAIDLSGPECPPSPLDSVAGTPNAPTKKVHAAIPLAWKRMMWPPPPPTPPPLSMAHGRDDAAGGPKHPPPPPKRPEPSVCSGDRSASVGLWSHQSSLARCGSVDKGGKKRREKKQSVHRETKL